MDQAKILKMILKALFSIGLKIHNDRILGKPLNKAQILLCEIVFIYLIVFRFFFLFRLGILI